MNTSSELNERNAAMTKTFAIEPMLRFGPSCRCGYVFVEGDEYAYLRLPDRGDGVTRDEAVCVICAEAASVDTTKTEAT